MSYIRLGNYINITINVELTRIVYSLDIDDKLGRLIDNGSL